MNTTTPEQQKREEIKQKLSEKVEKNILSTRKGAGGGNFTYIESWKAIEIANEIFGPDGWSCHVKEIKTLSNEEIDGRWNVVVSAVVAVNVTCLGTRTIHEDAGVGSATNRDRGGAFDNAIKEAVSDARKRALRLFGNAFGNCLYDKEYLQSLKSSSSTIKTIPITNLNKPSSKMERVSPNMVSTKLPPHPVKILTRQQQEEEDAISQLIWND